MSEYIAAALVLILIIGFIPQNMIQQRNHSLITKTETVIEAAKEEAAQAGMWTDDIITDLETKLSLNGIKKSEIQYGEMTTTIKYRTKEYDERELIKYEIGIPIKKLIANNWFYGISDEDNQYTHWFTGEIASERLPR